MGRRARAGRPKPQGVWAERFTLFETALQARKPDALRQVMAEIARLDEQRAAAVNRRDLFIARTKAVEENHSAITKRIEEGKVRMQAEIDDVAGRLGDLRALVRTLKAEPRANDEGPTPEVALKPAARDPIALLHDAGKLTDQQLASARTIAETIDAIASAGRMRISNAESGGGAGGGFREPELPEWMEQAWPKYRRWAERLSTKEGLPTLDIVVKICTYGLAVRALATKHKVRWEGVIERLQDGLDRYANTKS